MNIKILERFSRDLRRNLPSFGHIVYILWHGDEPIYIGRTRFPDTRFVYHAKKTGFTHFSLIHPSDTIEAKRTEYILLSMYRPKINRYIPHPNTVKAMLSGGRLLAYYEKWVNGSGPDHTKYMAPGYRPRHDNGLDQDILCRPNWEPPLIATLCS